MSRSNSHKLLFSFNIFSLCISYLGKRYSVPFRYVGQKLKIKETIDHHLEIYDH
ncbi:Mu transposase domain-containing protein [Halobacillus trueperi]|uniref:Mu transposase domain-containing protein n=1 Tax=Halobacillus trueperi TaxID=156205 RepID=UPI0037350909